LVGPLFLVSLTRRLAGIRPVVDAEGVSGAFGTAAGYADADADADATASCCGLWA
jgi:hypothetical protein